MKVPACVRAIATSGACTTAAVSDAESLPVLVSPPPLTVTLFVIVAGADAATLTVSVMFGNAAPAASESDRVHVRPASAQLHPLPDNPVAVRPAGKPSETVTAPDVAVAPTLLTLIV